MCEYDILVFRTHFAKLMKLLDVERKVNLEAIFVRIDDTANSADVKDTVYK